MISATHDLPEKIHELITIKNFNYNLNKFKYKQYKFKLSSPL